MALPGQIEWAARPASKPSQASNFNDEAVLSDLRSRDPLWDAVMATVTREQARWYLRRAANSHGCTGHCDKPEHKQDVDGLRELLDMLGLLGTGEKKQKVPGPERPLSRAKRRAAAALLAESMPRQSWSDDAACITVEPDLHYPAKTCGPDAEIQVREAKTVCGGCPVRRQCLSWALDTHEQHGIWGGLTPTERHNLRRRQRRAGRAA